VLVMARTIADPSYADAIAEGSGSVEQRWAAEVLATHRRTTGTRDARGAAQLPWPMQLGTPPWAVANELAARTGATWRARAVPPWSRGTALARVREAARTRPVPLYVGSRWLPRHVVLVLDADLSVYEPSGGRVERVDADDFTRGRLRLAGWTRPWFTVLPR
jgi:hypothetical protein